MTTLARLLFARKSISDRTPRPAARRARLRLEAFEDRLVPAAAWPDPYFAPYLNMLPPISFDGSEPQSMAGQVLDPARNGGNKFLVLGFVNQDLGNGLAAWDGQIDLGSDLDLQLRRQVAALRAQGGDVMISFGGAVENEAVT